MPYSQRFSNAGLVDTSIWRNHFAIHKRTHIHPFDEGVTCFRIFAIVEAILALIRISVILFLLPSRPCHIPLHRSPHHFVCHPLRHSHLLPRVRRHHGDASHISRQSIHVTLLSTRFVHLSEANPGCVQHYQ